MLRACTTLTRTKTPLETVRIRTVRAAAAGWPSVSANRYMVVLLSCLSLMLKSSMSSVCPPHKLEAKGQAWAPAAHVRAPLFSPSPELRIA